MWKLYYACLKYSKKEVQVHSLAEKKLKGQDLEWLCTPVESTEVGAASAKEQKKGTCLKGQRAKALQHLWVGGGCGRLAVPAGGPTSRRDAHELHYFGLWVKVTHTISLWHWERDVLESWKSIRRQIVVGWFNQTTSYKLNFQKI